MASGQTTSGPVASYQVITLPGWACWALAAGVLGASIYVAVGTLLTQAGVVRFSGPVVLILVAACMYQMTFVWVYRVDLTSDAVLWRSLTRRGRIPLDDLARIRNHAKKPSQVLFEGGPGACMRVAADERMRDFLAAVRTQAPHTEVSVLLHEARGRGQ